MEEKTPEQIRQEMELEIKKEEARAKAEAETMALAEIAQDPNKAIKSKINTQVAQFIGNSDVAKEKIEETAGKVLAQGLQAYQNQVDKDYLDTQHEKNKSEFKLDEDSYRAFGKDNCPKETWKKRMIQVGNDFWFVVLFIVCFFSLAPFYSFLKIIKTQSGVLKVIAVIIGVVLLLGILAGLTYGCLKWIGVIG